ELPWGGHAGEWLQGGQAAPAPPPPTPLVIEPPPWATEETGPLVRLPSPPSAPQPTALEVMRAEDGDVEWAPPPDWREEERERDRLRSAEAQQTLEPRAGI